MPNEALRELIATDQKHGGPISEPVAAIPGVDDIEPARILRASLEAVRRLDAERLASELRRAAVHLPLAALTDRVVVPLLAEIGVRWTRGHLGPAQEHAASAVVHRILGDIVRSCAPAPDAPVIVVATPMGQRHELGALLVAATAAAAGWRVIYLGADLPAAEIARAAESVGASIVALSIVHPGSDADLRADLDVLVELLPPGRQLVVGGSSATAYAGRLHRSGVLELESLAALRAFLSHRSATTPA
jgi:methanogenic corrinoid protein MtbC1